MTAKPLIHIERVTKRFPGTVALQDITFSILPGEVHTIAGENGAGKSTLMKILAGALSPDEGRIVIDGQQMSHFIPKEAAERGIGIIYQEFNLIPNLSVTANIMLGKEKRKGVFVQDKDNSKIAQDILDEMGVKIDPNQTVKHLGVAQQQLVEIAKALTQDVKVLIMDEPTAALTSEEVKTLFALIRQLKSKGVSVLYISHKFEEIFEISDRVTVLRDGQYIATHAIQDLNHDKLVRLMVGRELEIVRRESSASDEVMMQVENVSSEGNVRNISFTLHKGELLGIAGLLGAGRTELAKVLFGLLPLDSGHIILNGKRLDHISSPKHAMGLGMGLIPEDRKQQGLILDLMCEHNIVLPIIHKLLDKGFISDKKETKVVNEYQSKLSIKFYPGQFARQLSGGNQQKLVIAKTLATNVNLLIFDEPTRGVDIGSKQEIYKLMEELLKQGKSIIMISSEMSEILNLSDRIVVMREGEMSGILRREEATQEKIMYLASGIEEV